MFNKSPSNPDPNTPLESPTSSGSSSSQPLERTNSSSSVPPPPPLHSAPSFSIYAFDNLPIEHPTEEPTKDFSFGTESESESEAEADLIQRIGITNKGAVKSLPLFLARGLGIDRVGSGLLDAGAEGKQWKFPVEMGNEEEKLELETKLKSTVENEPRNAIALRDYAQFLNEVRGDAKRAEEYYSRAVLIEPPNGEILCEYAKLLWSLHSDVDRALTYFEKAICVPPKNSEILGSYAAFMWDIEEGYDTSGIEGTIECDLFPVLVEQ